MGILDGAPRRRPADIRPGFPQPLEDFIIRCLAPAPPERFTDAAQALLELQRVEGALSGTGQRRAAALKGRVQLLDIQVGEGSPDSAAVLARGLRSDLDASLSRNKGLQVHGAGDGGEFDFTVSATLSIDGPAATLALETVARRDGDTQQFTDRCTATDSNEWALQDELARVAMRALRARLSASGPAPTRPETRRSDDALRIVAKARDLLHRGRSKHAISATSLLRRAIELDRYCASAYGVLGEAMVRKYLLWDGDPTFLEEARENVDRALSLDGENALAHTALGFAHHLSGHLEDAQREYRTAMQSDQNEWFAHRLLGSIYAREGNFKSATGLLQRAIGINASHVASYDHLYSVLVRLDRYEEALEIADSGIAAGRQRLKAVPDDTDCRLRTATLYARLGRAREARAEIEVALEQGPRDGFTCYQAACVHALLADPDDLDRAIELLGSARDRGYFLFGELSRNTDLDVLRSLPSFQAIANEA